MSNHEVPTYQMRHFSADHGFQPWKEMTPFEGGQFEGCSLHRAILKAHAKGKTVTAKNDFGGGIEYRIVD